MQTLRISVRRLTVFQLRRKLSRRRPWWTTPGSSRPGGAGWVPDITAYHGRRLIDDAHELALQHLQDAPSLLQQRKALLAQHCIPLLGPIGHLLGMHVHVVNRTGFSALSYPCKCEPIVLGRF